MGAYAVIDGRGVVVNIILWDGIYEWLPPVGTIVVSAEGEKNCGIGGSYQSGVFSPPPQSIPEQDELIERARQYKASLLSAASMAISPLEDAVELGVATDNESNLYNEWRKYRVSVMRINISSAPDIIWPELPEV